MTGGGGAMLDNTRGGAGRWGFSECGVSSGGSIT